AQADQAKMQETANKSMASMNDAALAPDEAVPSLDKVRDKIESRYANALGAQELVEGSVQGRMTEIAEAGRDVKASSRLAEIRADKEKNKELEQQGKAITTGTDNSGTHNADATAPNAKLLIGVLVAAAFVVILNETTLSVALPVLMDYFE